MRIPPAGPRGLETTLPCSRKAEARAGKIPGLEAVEGAVCEEFLCRLQLVTHHLCARILGVAHKALKNAILQHAKFMMAH
jgi:hypothetical protein